ncbi:MAG: 50S ribosomal protein L9 [Gemmatimonadota bacterium]|jgi:large subunit ribosomal protein L9|nr:50S ribosomal protein L9 [Gemmatimonadota bacterium]
MQIILKERLDNLGDIGEVVSVKPGYARNYLIPKGLAYAATPGNLKRIERERAQYEKRTAAERAEARQRAAVIEATSVTFSARAGEEGKLFGSITAADIAEKMAEQGIVIDRRQIVLDEPLKALGVFSVPVKLHADVRPEIKVWVIKEE